MRSSKSGDRPSAGGGHRDGVVVGAAHGAEPVAFGQAVGGQHDVDVEFCLHPLDQHDRHRGRAGDREPQRGQVVAAAGGMVEQRLVDGRGSGQHGDPVLADRTHRPLGVEGQLRDQRGAGLQAGQDPGLVAEVVEERVDAQVAVVAGDLAARRPRRRAGQRLPVRAQHTFAAAGGAGGEQDVGEVVGVYRGGAGIGGAQGCTAGAARHEVVPRPVVRINRHPHDMPQIGQRGPVKISGLVGTQELAHRHQQRSTGAGQDVGGLGGGIAGVQRYHGGAGVMGGQAGNHPMPGVRRPDRHPVARAHTQRDHRRRGTAHLVAQLGKSEGAIGRDQRVVFGKLARDAVQHRRDGLRIARHRCMLL